MSISLVQEKRSRREKGDIRIKFARPRDMEAVRKLVYRTWLHTYPCSAFGITVADLELHFKLAPQSKEERAEFDKMLNASEDRFVILARTRRGIIGFSRGSRVFAQIQSLYVDPRWQGQGVGGALLRDALALIGTDKVVSLEVVRYNDRAMLFYERYGFRVQGSVPFEKTAPLRGSGKRMPRVRMVRAHLKPSS